jgi:hypothetical protein
MRAMRLLLSYCLRSWSRKYTLLELELIHRPPGLLAAPVRNTSP